MSSKLTTAERAIGEFVSDGSSVHLGGFGHLYPYGLVHEMIRQRKRNLTICKHSPELMADQLIGAGCVRKLLFGYVSNPRVGAAHCFDRAIKSGIPNQLELEEYSHQALTTRLRAGAYGLSFLPSKTMMGSDYQKINQNVKKVTCPFTGNELVALPALEPEVTLIHVQRSDEEGNSHVWGIIGDIREAVIASKRVIISAEEIVSSDVIRSDPNRTAVPGFKVSAVVEQPWGAHPSYAQGYYDRDNEYYFEYEAATRSGEDFQRWLSDWVLDLKDRSEYVKKLGSARLEKLKPKYKASQPINYGRYEMW